MAKQQTSYATNAANNLINQAQGITQPIISGLESRYTMDQSTADMLGNSLMGTYGQQLTTGGYDPTQLGILRGNTSNLASTGGYDPTQLAALQGQIDTARGGYGKMAETGGFSPTDISNYLNTATAGVRGSYDVLQAQAARAGAAGGGSGAAAISQMARQGANAASAADVAAQSSLTQQINANKLAGLGGETALAGLSGQLQGQVAGAKAAGVGQQIGLETGVAGGAQGAAGGLLNMFSQITGKSTADITQTLQAMGLDFSTQEGAIQALTTLSKNPSVLSQVLQDLSTVGGMALGGYLGGLAKRPAAPTTTV